MKRITLSIYFFLLIMVTTTAQNKQFTLEDLIPGGSTYSDFVPKTELNYRWMGDELVGFGEDQLSITNPINKRLFVFTQDELRSLVNDESANIKRLSFVTLDNKDYAQLILPEKIVYFDLYTKEIELEIPLQKGWKNYDFCSENRSLAFTKSNNLYITNAHSEPFAVEENARRGIVSGQSVHRDEFGIHKGTFWSPKGNYLAFYRMDETMVADYPLVNIPTPKVPSGSDPLEAKLNSIKYPMAGQTSHQVTLGIYHLQSGKTIYLQTGEPKDHYLTNVCWDPSEEYVYIAELNREQNHMQFNKYNVETGVKVSTLFEERNERYVEPQYPAMFLKTNPAQFIWQSQRDGYNHLYLYNTEGKLIKQLTSGNYPVTQVLGFDKEEKHIFIQANEESPLNFHVYKVNLKTGKKAKLSSEEGVHHAMLNASGTYLIDRYSNQTTPLNIDLIETNKGVATRLQTAPNPYEGYTLPEITLGKLKADDNETDLYYRLVKPVDFDPSKKYPTIVYVYGGPHMQSVLNSWMGAVRGWDIYMAQKGYIVFTMDNRGTANRGFEFESIIHRNLGVKEVSDQMKGVEFLLSQPYVDAKRFGVHGWSYGGFMTSNLMLRHNDVFKVGVAGGPVIDWSYYEAMYGERYMDTPAENPAGYEYANINNLAGNLKGRFLLIHGDEDPTVVWQHSLSFLKACIATGTYPDYFVYPGQGHNMMGRDRIHLHEKITRYFEDNL